MQSSTLNIRGLNYFIQEWGEPEKPLLLVLHGWMDCGATFKYIAEHLCERYYVVAPDWRGFGNTDHASAYWFPDYFADLDKILDHYSDNKPAQIVGHSMGGNIALMYAGIQPTRVNKVLSLDALGMPPTSSQEAPAKYRRWLREITSDEPFKVYPNFDALCRSVHKGNSSLDSDIIVELAKLWGKPHGDDGAYCLKHDHAHRYTNPVRYNFDDVLALWREVTAEVGLVMAAKSNFFKHFSESGRIDQAKETLKISESDYFELADCGHMLHLEQPEETADCILKFFG